MGIVVAAVVAGPPLHCSARSAESSAALTAQEEGSHEAALSIQTRAESMGMYLHPWHAPASGWRHISNLADQATRILRSNRVSKRWANIAAHNGWLGFRAFSDCNLSLVVVGAKC